MIPPESGLKLDNQNRSFGPRSGRVLTGAYCSTWRHMARESSKSSGP